MMRCLMHRWGKWKTAAEGRIHQKQSWSEELRHVGYWTMQERCCERCGKLKMRTMRQFL